MLIFIKYATYMTGFTDGFIGNLISGKNVNKKIFVIPTKDDKWILMHIFIMTI